MPLVTCRTGGPTCIIEFMKHVLPRLESPQSPGCTISACPTSPVLDPKLYRVEMGPATEEEEDDGPGVVSLCCLFTAPPLLTPEDLLRLLLLPSLEVVDREDVLQRRSATRSMHRFPATSDTTLVTYFLATLGQVPSSFLDSMRSSCPPYNPASCTVASMLGRCSNVSEVYLFHNRVSVASGMPKWRRISLQMASRVSFLLNLAFLRLVEMSGWCASCSSMK